jgi:hypothetical protein
LQKVAPWAMLLKSANMPIALEQQSYALPTSPSFFFSN